MQIHSLTRFIAFPFIIAGGYVFYKNATDDYFSEAYSWILFPLLIILVALYILSPSIDFWWHQKYPIKIGPPVIKWLNQYSSFYQGLNETQKAKFEKRLSLFMESKEFILMTAEKDTMPDDMKAIIACNAIHLTFDTEDYLVEGYDRIVAYMHPFPTPFYKHLHTVEIEEVDGVVLLCIDYVVRGMTHETEYNIALHAFAEIHMEKHQNTQMVDISKEDAGSLEEVSGISHEAILQTIGFDQVDTRLVALHHYLRYPEKFKSIMPDMYQKISELLKA